MSNQHAEIFLFSLSFSYFSSSLIFLKIRCFARCWIQFPHGLMANICSRFLSRLKFGPNMFSVFLCILFFWLLQFWFQSADVFPLVIFFCLNFLKIRCFPKHRGIKKYVLSSGKSRFLFLLRDFKLKLNLANFGSDEKRISFVPSSHRSISTVPSIQCLQF